MWPRTHIDVDVGRFWQELGVQVRKSDEMETLVSGVQCLIDHVVDECFTWLPPSSYSQVSPPHPRACGRLRL